jgi:hypothetical protein
MIESGNAIIISFVILLMRLAWGQRYTNAPGNITWPLLFLVYQWSSKFFAYMLIIGIGTALVCVLTLFLHLFTFIKTSTSTKRVLTIGWGFCIGVLLALEGLAVVIYLISGNVSEYIDVYAKITLTVFIVVNILDVLFWIWGMKTLDHEKGDQVRDTLFGGIEN